MLAVAAMRVIVIGALLISSTVAHAQHPAYGQGDETTATGYQTPQPVPGATAATVGRKPETGFEIGQLIMEWRASLGDWGELALRGGRQVLVLTWFWRQSTGDGVYDIGGGLLRPDSGSHARFIGLQPEANVAWNIDRNISLYAVYSMIFPGEFIKQSGPADTVYFAAGQVQWRY